MKHIVGYGWDIFYPQIHFFKRGCFRCAHKETHPHHSSLEWPSDQRWSIGTLRSFPRWIGTGKENYFHLLLNLNGCFFLDWTAIKFNSLATDFSLGWGSLYQRDQFQRHRSICVVLSQWTQDASRIQSSWRTNVSQLSTCCWVNSHRHHDGWPLRCHRYAGWLSVRSSHSRPNGPRIVPVSRIVAVTYSTNAHSISCQWWIERSFRSGWRFQK